MTASANVKATYTLKYYTGAAWVDITSDAMRSPFVPTWGMADNNPLTFMANTGGMTFTLNNVAGHYSPETATVSTGWAKGTPIQLILTYDGIAYVRFRGRVDTLVFHSELTDVKNVDVSCLDWLDFAAKYPLTNPQVANNITGDVAMAAIIATMPIKPTAQLLDVGNYPYPSLLDAVSVRTTAYEEFNKLALSEMSYCYLRHDKVNGETFVFENNTHRAGTTPLSAIPKLVVDSGFILKAGSATDHILRASTTDKLIPALVDNASFTNNALGIGSTYGENIVNRFVINTYPKTIDTGAVILYNLGAPLKIASGATKKVIGKYRNPVGGKEISGLNMIPPVATTDYLMNTKKNGTGTDITANLTVVCSYDSSKPTYTLTNTYTSVGYVTYLKARGYGIYQDDTLTVPLENAASQLTYGVNELTLEQTYQQDTDLGTLIGGEVLEYNKTPHTKTTSITFNANFSTFTMQAFLNTDIGSLIQIIDTQYDINDWFYVQGVSFSLEISGLINASWIVKKASSILSGGLVPIGVTFPGWDGSHNHSLNFGNNILIKNLTKFSISFWMTPTGAADKGILGYSDGSSGFIVWISGVHLFIDNLQFTSYGRFRMDDVLTMDTLTHAIITYDLTSMSKPSMYQNNSISAVTTVSTPSGSYNLAMDDMFFIGGSQVGADPWAIPFDGLIKDVRLYNRILTDAEVTAIYNGGTPLATAGTTLGMIFQGPCVRTSELSNYVGHTLTADLPVLDNINGYVGSIVGSPAGVAF